MTNINEPIPMAYPMSRRRMLEVLRSIGLCCGTCGYMSDAIKDFLGNDWFECRRQRDTAGGFPYTDPDFFCANWVSIEERREEA